MDKRIPQAFKNSISTTVLILVWCLPALAQSAVQISLGNSTAAEKQIKENLERLLKTYDVAKWIATPSIVIDEKTAIPHSHPVLTINTRHLKDDELLLATFIHEQMHWFVSRDEKKLDAAVAEFRKMFPAAPAGPPEGANDQASTYLHIGVCYLEYRALRELLGELKAKQVMEFWSTDHYKWVYRTVLEKPREIGTIMFKYDLVPMEEKKSSK
jgi:hypothetical protein